jgi:hypothetical protein
VFYPRTAAEVLALDILARHGWQTVTQDMVQPVRRIRARVKGKRPGGLPNK